LVEPARNLRQIPVSDVAHRLVTAEQVELRSDDHERQIAFLHPDFVQRAMHRDPVQVLAAVATLTVTVEKDKQRPFALSIGLIAGGQIDEVLPLVAGCTGVGLPHEARLCTLRHRRGGLGSGTGARQRHHCRQKNKAPQ
jgi:hypothetical protein